MKIHFLLNNKIVIIVLNFLKSYYNFCVSEKLIQLPTHGRLEW